MLLMARSSEVRGGVSMIHLKITVGKGTESLVFYRLERRMLARWDLAVAYQFYLRLRPFCFSEVY